MIKELQYKGYATEPSDYECPDGQLATSLNLINEDEQLKPVFQPAEKFALNAGEQLLWIHKMNGHTHYILSIGNKLYWVCKDNGEGDTEPFTRHEISGASITGAPTLESIGNTLIASDDGGVAYFLWTTEQGTPQYVALGQKPPMLEISFGLHSEFAVVPDKKNRSGTINDYGGASFVTYGYDSFLPMLGQDAGNKGAAWAAPQPVMAADTGQEEPHPSIKKFAEQSATYSVENITGNDDDEKGALAEIKNTLTQGVFAQINKFVSEKGVKENKFVLPFFVRYAYRLNDNSYIMHSYPVLMIPNSRGPIFALEGSHGLCLKDNSNHVVVLRMCGRACGFLASLVYSITSIPTELKKWRDIITSVDIGVSAPIYTYDQAGTVFGWTNMDDEHAWDEYYSVSKVVKFGDKDVASPAWNGAQSFKAVFQNFDTATRKKNESDQDQGYGDFFNRYDSTYTYPNYIATVPQRNISEINNDLTGATSFYIIKQLALDELEECQEKDLNLDKGTIGGLLGRLTIDDDYHTHDKLKAALIYNYNGRVNFAGVNRWPHAPLSPVVQFPQQTAPGGNAWQVAVAIKNDLQTLVVQSTAAGNFTDFPHWLFYPDCRATAAYVTHGGSTYRLPLKPHDFLNGAYWMADIMAKDVTLPEQDALPTITPGEAFDERNKLYTSNANNPFFFAPDNIKTIGVGKIIGLSSAAKALSPSQFGQFPLYAFTDEGVWALEVSDTGTFKPSQPFTYDVCINPASITRLDNTVLFVTDRGIIHVSGSQTQCITDNIFSEAPFNVLDLPGIEQLHSKLGHDADTCLPVKAFLGFLAGCRMVYDYIHQRIIVFNPTTTTSNGVTTQNYSYAYVFSLKSRMWGMMYSNLDYSVNSYPDSLAVTKAGKLVSFSETDEQVCKGLYITRPLKLEAADVHKTISALIQRGHFQRGDVGTVLYGSRDLFTWHLVWSSKDHYLRGFRGTPYKYFRIAGLATLTDGKSIFGASVYFELRHTNQLR